MKPRNGRRPGPGVRLLLGLLPAHLRAEHEREIDQLLRDQAPAGVAERRRNGLGLLVDVIRAAPGAHLDVLRQDLVIAGRQLRRSPGFAATAALTLAIGIGSSVALFSVVDAVLLQPLPYPGPDRLVSVTEDNIERGFMGFGISPGDYRALTADTTVFASSAAFQSRSGTALVGAYPERVGFTAVSAAFFDVLGVRAAQGRTFDPDDDVAGSTSVVLSHDFWAGSLGGARDAIGGTVRLDDVDYRIVGIMPAGFAFPNAGVAMWTALGLTPHDFEQHGARWLAAVARLRPGVNVMAANDGVAASARRLAEIFPVNRGWSASVEGLQTAIVGAARVPILLAWGAAGLILLIATANVTNLFLGRSLTREGEMAIRGALGARPGRLGRQLLTEGLVLAALGGSAGLGVAALLVSQLRALGAEAIPRVADVTLNSRAVMVTLGLVLVTTLLFSLLPAISGSRVDLRRAMDAGRRSANRRHRRWQSALVAAEAAVAVVVVVASSLLVRSLVLVLDQALGITPHGAVTFRVEPPWHANLQAPDGAARLQAERSATAAGYAVLTERLSALPGVEAVGAVNRLPLTGNWWVTGAAIAGRPADANSRIPAWVRVVTPGYFAAVGTRVVRGRGILSSDGAAAERVALVDETFARTYWPDGDPIGAELLLDGPPGGQIRARIVGIAEAVHMNQLDAELRPTFYVPFSQSTEGHFLNWGMDVVIRRTGRGDLTQAIRGAVGTAFPGTPAFAVRALDDQVRASVAPRRFQVVTIGTFAVVALVLTLIGVYGVLALAVRERAREFGIRRVLGASPRTILAEVLRGGLAMAGAGALAGTLASLAASRLLASLVYGIAVTDPVALVVGPLTIALVAAIAASSAARQAMRVDPAVVLRD